MLPQLVTVDPDGDLLLLLREPSQDISTDTANGDAEQENASNEAAINGHNTGIGKLGMEDKVADREDGSGLHLLVSSKHMMLVSPVFRAMLQHNFKEGATLRSQGKVEIPLPDEEPRAFQILVDIIHCRLGMVPLSIDLDLLTHIAVLVDKYQMPTVVQVFIDIWLRGVGPPPVTFSEDMLLWLGISWVFELESQFETITSLLQREMTLKDITWMMTMSKWELPIPDTVMVAIEESRQKTIRDALSQLDALIKKYQGPGTVCNTVDTTDNRKLFGKSMTTHRNECDALVLGSVIRSAFSCGLYPFPQAPYSRFSAQRIIEFMSVFDIQTACRKIYAVQTRPMYGGYNEPTPIPTTYCVKVIDSWKEPLREIYKQLSGLKLSDFKKITKHYPPT